MNRRLFVLLALLVLLAGLTACSTGNPQPAATPTPNPGVTGRAAHTPDASHTPTRTAARTRAHTPAPTEFVLPEPVGTPAARWSGIPIMPEATAGEEDEGAYFFSVAATPEEVAAYYAEELPPLGWQPFAEGTGENGAMLILYKKGGSILTISIIALEDHVQVLITLI